MTTVLIADEAPLLRDGVRRALEQLDGVRVTGEAGDASTLLKLARSRPDVVVVDVDLKDSAVQVTIRALRKASERSKLLVMTARDEPQVARRVLDEGVEGYVLKSVDRAGLQEVFRILMMGERVIDRAVESKLTRRTEDSDDSVALNIPSSTALSDRDIQLLQWMVVGDSNLNIASRLGVSERTAKGYIRAVFDKLGAKSRLEAIVTAAR